MMGGKYPDTFLVLIFRSDIFGSRFGSSSLGLGFRHEIGKTFSSVVLPENQNRDIF